MLFWLLKTLTLEVEMSNFRQRLNISYAPDGEVAERWMSNPDCHEARAACDAQKEVGQARQRC